MKRGLRPIFVGNAPPWFIEQEAFCLPIPSIKNQTYYTIAQPHGKQAKKWASPPEPQKEANAHGGLAGRLSSDSYRKTFDRRGFFQFFQFLTIFGKDLKDSAPFSGIGGIEEMPSEFFAMLSRMKYIDRWG